jgi:hypothetical protein
MTEVADRISILDFTTGHLILPSGNGPYGRGLMRTDWHAFAPRLGFAYRVPGITGFVARGGYGISYIAEFGGNGFNAALNPPGSFIQNFTYSTIQPPPVTLSMGIPPAPPIDLNNPFGQIRMVDPNVVPAYAQQWNFTLQREFKSNWLVEAGYLGTKGTHLLLGTDADQPVPGAGAIANRRPLFAVAPNVTTSVAKSVGDSIYHSLQAKLEKRFSHGLSLVGSYTLSKNIDDGDGNFSDGVTGVSSFGTPQNPFNLRGERGLASSDQRNRFVGNYSWGLPFGKKKKWGGWQLSGITTFASGNPFDILFSPSTLNTGTNQRPDRIANGNLPSSQRSIYQWFNVGAFAAPAAFVYGNSGRNVLTGPGLKTWDASVLKDTHFTERYNLQFRTDFFNLANTPQFNPPGNTIGTAQAGQISSTRFSTNRQIQLVLKLYF